MPRNLGESSVDSEAVARDIAHNVAERHGLADSPEGGEAQQPSPPRDISHYQEADNAEKVSPEGQQQREGQAREEGELHREAEDTQRDLAEGAEGQREERERQLETQPEEVDSTFTDEDYEELVELGIDVPMRPSEVPQELRPAYDELVQSALDSRKAALDEMKRAYESRMEVEEFSQKFQESPQDIMVLMALQKPDAFSNAMEMYRRMQNDEEFRDMKLSELESKARLSAAERKERALTRTEAESKAATVKARTHRMARRHGIDPQKAEEYVADRIRRNNGRISIDEIDQVVSDLGGGQTKRSRTATRKTPQEQERESQSPGSVEGRGTSPDGAQSETEGQRRTGMRSTKEGDIFDLVRGASKRVRSSRRDR